MSDHASEALAKAREQLERARERVRMLEARETARQRKQDTRRKILLGALLIERMQRQGEEAHRLQAWVRRELPGFLSRDHDKALFAGWFADPATPAETSSDS